MKYRDCISWVAGLYKHDVHTFTEWCNTTTNPQVAIMLDSTVHSSNSNYRPRLSELFEKEVLQPTCDHRAGIFINRGGYIVGTTCVFCEKFTHIEQENPLQYGYGTYQKRVMFSEHLQSPLRKIDITKTYRTVDHRKAVILEVDESKECPVTARIGNDTIRYYGYNIFGQWSSSVTALDLVEVN